MYCDLSVKTKKQDVVRSEREDKKAENAAKLTKIVNIFVLCLSLHVWLAKNPKAPN